MSSSVLHRCPVCYYEIEAWDDGHPYILDDKGKARFYYHPIENEQRRRILDSCAWAMGKRPEELAILLEQNSGVMSEFLCLDCRTVSKVDAEKRTPVCRKCRSGNVCDVKRLNGVACPKCGKGRFPENPPLHAIS